MVSLKKFTAILEILINFQLCPKPMEDADIPQQLYYPPSLFSEVLYPKPVGTTCYPIMQQMPKLLLSSAILLLQMVHSWSELVVEVLDSGAKVNGLWEFSSFMEWTAGPRALHSAKMPQTGPRELPTPREKWEACEEWFAISLQPIIYVIQVKGERGHPFWELNNFKSFCNKKGNENTSSDLFLDYE